MNYPCQQMKIILKIINIKEINNKHYLSQKYLNKFIISKISLITHNLDRMDK